MGRSAAGHILLRRAGIDGDQHARLTILPAVGADRRQLAHLRVGAVGADNQTRLQRLTAVQRQLPGIVRPLQRLQLAGHSSVKLAHCANCCHSASCRMRFSTIKPSSGSPRDTASNATRDDAHSRLQPAIRRRAHRRHGLPGAELFQQPHRGAADSGNAQIRRALRLERLRRLMFQQRHRPARLRQPRAAAAPTMPPPTTTASYRF